MNLRRTLAPALLVALASLAACGDDSSGSATDDPTGAPASSPAGTPADEGDGEGAGDAAACDLLTTDEVADAVGSPVKAGIATSGPAITGGDFSTCVWQSADPESPADTATLTVYDNAAAADSAREDDSQDLDGIGDRAFSASVSSVWVYDGDRSFFVQWYVFGTMDDEGLEQSKALAAAVADAL